MKKKILVVFIVLCSIVSLTALFSFKNNSLDKDYTLSPNQLASASDPNLNVIGSLNVNERLEYAQTDTTINGWKMGIFNEIYTESTINPGTGSNRSFSASSSYSVLGSNPQQNMGLRVQTPPNNPGNLKTLYAMFTSVQTGLILNEDYIIRFEGNVYAGHVQNFGLTAIKSNDINGEVINFSDFEVRSLSVHTLRFKANVDTVTIGLKVYNSSSENYSSHLISSVRLYKYAEYHVQDLLYKLHNSTSRDRLISSNLETVETQLVELEQYLALNDAKIRTEIKDDINPYIARIREIVDIKNEINNAYTNETKMFVKDTVTQQTIDALRTRTNATTYLQATTELRTRVNELELDLRKQTRVNSLEALFNSLDGQIDALTNLTPEEKTSAKTRLSNVFTLEEGKIRTATTLSNVDIAYDNGVTELNKEYLATHKIDAKNELQNLFTRYSAEINNLAHLDEAAKQSYINLITTENNTKQLNINTATSTTDVDTLRNEGKTNLNAVRLNAEKANAVADITQKRNEVRDQINAYTHLTTAEKQVYLDNLEEILSRRTTEINSKTAIEEIAQVVVDTKAEMDLELLKANKEESIKEVRDKKTEVENSIRNNPVYTEEEKQQRIDELDTLLTEAETRINDQNNLTDVETEKEKALKDLDDKNITLRKERNKQSLQSILDEEKTKIEGLTFLSPEEKASYKSQLDDIKAGADRLMDEGKTNEAIDLAFNNGARDLRGLTFEARKQNGNNEIDAEIETFKNNGGNLTEGLTSQLNDIKNRIDQATTEQEIADLVNEAKGLLTPSTREEIERSLNRLKEYYDNQKQTHKFKSADAPKVNSLYETLYDKIDKGEYTYEVAKDELAALITLVTDLKFDVKNMDFDIFDEQVEYPENSENLVYAGIRGDSGFRSGTTLDISKQNITDEKKSSLIAKLENSTLTIPSDSTLTTAQIQQKLKEMEYLRLVSINLKNADGTGMTDFDGLYLVSLLIPTEYRQYAEFLVVYEGANGLEVFKTYRNNAWMTFETRHFSDFYVLGVEESTTETVTEEHKLYDFLALILASILFILIIIVFIVHRSVYKNVRVNSFSLLPVLLLGFNSFYISIVMIIAIALLSSVLIKKIIKK